MTSLVHSYNKKKYFTVVLVVVLSACATEYTVVDKDSQYLAELQQEKPYIIGCGDKLQLLVWGHEELTTTSIVRPDGKISLPLVGDIQAEGLTVEELKKELNKRMSEYIHEPALSILVTEVGSLKIYMVGEVTRPGEYDLVSYTTVLQAIAMAGGFTDFARKSKIQIIRTQGAEKIKIKFNYKEVVKGKHLDQNIPLRPGDIIVVP